MGEGLPLPWPFPWSTEQPVLAEPLAVSSSRSSQRKTPTARGVSESPASYIHNAAAAASAEFDQKLPEVRSVELHLIRGLVNVSLGGQAGIGVIAPPEFLYVLDVGLDSFVGGFFVWRNVAYGDPTFPDLSTLQLRSITAKESSHLIFPKIPGSLLVGIAEGVSTETVKEGLTKAGLKDVDTHGFFATARCAPFMEETVCKELTANVPFVRHAGPDRVVRLVDFGPGWQSVRLA